MWLFTGRYAQYGPAICAIAASVAAVAVTFFVMAVRSIQRSDLACILVVVTVAGAFSESGAYGEPVFASNHLNLGVALLLAIVGLSLGIGGVFLSKKLRLSRVVILVAASAILLGDLTGWIWRSAGPSKFDGGSYLRTNRTISSPPLP